MLLPILIGIVVLIALFCTVVALRPDEFIVSRSTAISAPPSVVFGYVNDLHKWQEFSPWAKLDPAAKNSFEGPGAGLGATFAWVGNSKVGEGRMTITESRADELIRFRLDFLKPFAATNTAEFIFKSEGGQTVVTWSMFGKSNFFFKAMGLFMNCDKMVGAQFSEGLASLKALAEAQK